MSTPVARSFLDDDADPLKSPARPETAPRVARDEPGALVSPLAASGPSPSPLSFKRKPQPARRTASSASAVRDKAASLIGGILRHGSAGQADHEAAAAAASSASAESPAFRRRVDARPRYITLPNNNTVKHKPSLSEFSQAVASDDDDDEGETTAGESPQRRSSSAAILARGDEADRHRQRRLSGSNKRAVSKAGSVMIGQRSRRPTGSGMYGSPVKDPGALSPLWGDHAYGGGDDDRPSDETLFGADAGPLEVTPLPKIPIFVLSICMLGEFLSASVCSPFLFLYATPPLPLLMHSAIPSLNT